MTRNAEAVPRSWWEDEPARLEREREAMREAGPALAWDPAEPSGGWRGSVPDWPFERPRPRGLTALLEATNLEVQITCGNAYPMIEPTVWPRSVEVPWQALGWTAWHVLPTGSLCLLRAHSDWDPGAMVADLVPKISGWYIEYRLMRMALITEMTVNGLSADDSLDALIDGFVMPGEGENK